MAMMCLIGSEKREIVLNASLVSLHLQPHSQSKHLDRPQMTIVFPFTAGRFINSVCHLLASLRSVLILMELNKCAFNETSYSDFLPWCHFSQSDDHPPLSFLTLSPWKLSSKQKLMHPLSSCCILALVHADGRM